MSGRNAFSIESTQDGDVQRIAIQGVIDETSDLSALGAVSAPKLELVMRGVRRINSFGVRAWLDAIRMVPQSTRVAFVQCPPPVVDQTNMVAGFLGHGEIVSFYAPMTCAECDEQVDQLFRTADCVAHGNRLPPTPCPRCGRTMEVDDLEEQYLLFVREGAR